MRTKGVALTLATNYSANFASLFVNPIGIQNIGWKYYIVFDCFLVVILTTIYLFFPETKGFSLEEIAKIFDGEKVVPDETMISSLSRKQPEQGDGARADSKVYGTSQVEVVYG